jgi:hypothetical protein
MRFEARELKSSAEPVKAIELVEGGVYFSVSYVDTERLIPVLEPYVFVGRNLAPGDSGQLYFQSMDPVRRSSHRKLSTRDDYADFHLESESQPCLLEYEQALEDLMVCSLRRRGTPDDLPVGSGATPTAGPLRFEARDLEFFSQPVNGGELKEGSVYFSVFFVDDGYLIPGLAPYIFIGRDIDSEEAGLYFQDMDSYQRGVRHGMAVEGPPATLAVDSDDNLNHFEYEQALAQLLACSLRRRGMGDIDSGPRGVTG